MPIVLVIDGGGTCGFFSQQILKKLNLRETATRTPDLILGVSAGAIVGALVAQGLLAGLTDSAIQMYTLQLFSDASVRGPWLSPKYTGACKSSVLSNLFGDICFGQVQVPMAILVDRIGNKPVLCWSWDPVYKDVPLVKILDATSAVPGMFPPITINGEQYLDGGTVTGSPICLAHLMALELFPPPQVICLLSLGTEPRKSVPTQRFDNSEMGIVQLISLGIPIKVLTQGSTLVNDLSKQILGPRYLRIEGAVSAPLDDISVFTTCIEAANSVWSDMEVSIVDFQSLSPAPVSASQTHYS